MSEAKQGNRRQTSSCVTSLVPNLSHGVTHLHSLRTVLRAWGPTRSHELPKRRLLARETSLPRELCRWEVRAKTFSNEAVQAVKVRMRIEGICVGDDLEYHTSERVNIRAEIGVLALEHFRCGPTHGWRPAACLNFRSDGRQCEIRHAGCPV